jgi:hypothetical protein
MIGELIGDFRGKIAGVRILSGEHTEMYINGTGKIFGIEATYASTGVFSRMPNGVLVEKGNGLITTLDHDFAV